MKRGGRKKRAMVKEAASPDKCESVRAVFGNDYLREMILDLAIHNDDDNGNRIDRKSLVNLRQVQKSWRITIDHRLHHLKEPLFTVKLDESNSLNGTPLVEANGKALDRFTAFFAGRDDNFRLKLGEEFFRLENYESLSNCLWRCAKSLVKLEFEIPENLGSFPGIFPSGGLPNLQKLSVTLTTTQLDNLEQERDYDTPPPFGHPSHVFTFVGTIVGQSANLKEITISYRSETPRWPLPFRNFRYLTLPASLEKLTVESAVDAEELRVLERNPLAALTHLKLTVMELPLPEGTLFNVLRGCQATLKEFYLQACGPSGRFAPNVLKFPEMRKLRRLTLRDFCAQLDPDTKANLNACFPKLESLQLKMPLSLSRALASWIEGTQLQSVKTFTVMAKDWQRVQGHGFRDRCLPSTTNMGMIMQGMPNVRELTLRVDGQYPMDLSPLFEKLKLITCLKLELMNAIFIENSDVFDSLLTGLPLEVVEAIRLNPSFEENWGIVRVKNATIPSIRLMNNLTTLSLVTCDNFPGESLLSRVTFKHAFFQMPKLRTLILKHGFNVSQDMAQEWEQAGRIIHQD